MTKYYTIFANRRFGRVSYISYMYYLLFELASPVVEVMGILSMVIAAIFGVLNFKFMLKFILLYSAYGAILTLTAFFQRIYTQNLSITVVDVIRAILMCFLENIFFRYLLSFGRIMAFVGYKKNKNRWGSIKRVKHNT